MASDDQTNPYARPSHWPSMPQGTMRLGPLPKAAAPARPEPPPERVREPVRFEPEAVEPAPEATAAATPGSPFFGPTPRSTHPALSPTEALLRTPEVATEAAPPAPPAPEGDIGRFGDLDLAIPTPADEALVVPIAARRAGARGRKSSPLVPILAASAMGVVGVGVLAGLMSAGQRAAAPPVAALPPSAPAATEPEVPPAPAVDAAPLAPAAAQVATSTPPVKPAAAARPAPQRLAAAVRARATPPRAADPPQPYVLDIPPPQAEPTRITIPPPALEPAPAPPPAPRTPAPGPDQPMATHPPD